MKIARRGAFADHGESSIELKAPSFVWRKLDSNMTIKHSGVKDFSTKSRHSYTISLSLPEMADLIQSLSDAALADPALFEEHLEPSLKAITRLQAVVAGLKT